MRRIGLSVVAMLMALAVAPAAFAQAREVVIGVLYPMTGPSAQIGIDARNIINVAVDIVNNGANINLPLAKSK